MAQGHERWTVNPRIVGLTPNRGKEIVFIFLFLRPGNKVTGIDFVVEHAMPREFGKIILMGMECLNTVIPSSLYTLLCTGYNLKLKKFSKKKLEIYSNTNLLSED